MLNLAMVLTENAQRVPDRIAVICDERKLTYGELEATTNRLANALVSLGLHRGQKVLVMLPNIPEFVVSYFGILKPGGVVVPINILYKDREIEFLLEDSEAVALVACTEYLSEALEAFRNVDTCKHLILVDYPAEAPAIGDKGIVKLRRVDSHRLGGVRDGGHRPRRHGGHRLHQRHYRQAQGGRAVALQLVLPGPRAADAQHRSAARRPTCGWPCCRCFTPTVSRA